MVLILVVMEEGQRLQAGSKDCYRRPEVLILVVMEEGQRHRPGLIRANARGRLNPCCNGRGSKTITGDLKKACDDVLILVVMEEGQRPLSGCLPVPTKMS